MNNTEDHWAERKKHEGREGEGREGVMEDLQRREKVHRKTKSRERGVFVCLCVIVCVCALCVVVEHTFPSLLPANVAS